MSSAAVRPGPGRVVLALAVAPVLVLASSCGAASETFDDLAANPERYHGRTITLKAFYYQSFEVNVMSPSLKESSQVLGRLEPSPPLIWLEGGLPTAVYTRLRVQTFPNGPSVRYGRVRVTGVFRSGGGFGHVGAYDYQLTPTPEKKPRVELME